MAMLKGPEMEISFAVSFSDNRIAGFMMFIDNLSKTVL